MGAIDEVIKVTGPVNAPLVEFQGNVAVVPEVFVVTTELLAASVDKWAFVAPFPCEVIDVREIHSVVGGASAAVRPRLITNVSAPGAAAGANVIEMTAAFDLTATVNTVVTGTIVAAAARLAAGEKIGLDFSGTLTGLVGHLSFTIKRIGR